VDSGDYGVWDPTTGKTVSLKTGKPWNGKETRTGKTYTNGVEATDPNANQPPNLQAKEIVKDPAVATAQQGLMKTFTDSANSSLQDFSKYLAQFKTDLSTARTKAAAATDPTPTINALTQAQNQYSGALDSSNASYQKALADAAARTRGVVQQANDTLPAYDAAANAIADRQTQEAVRQVGRYKMGSGTPTSMGSAEQQILGRSIADARLPLEQAKINQRFNILGTLAMPTEQTIAGQNLSYSGNYLPGIAGSRYGSQTSTANSIQALKAQVAGMSFNDAMKFMQSAGIPAQIQQQILGGQINELGALGGIADQSHYRYIQDPQAMSLSTPMFPNSGIAPYPNNGQPGRYQQPGQQGGQPGPGVPLAGNAPVQVGPGGIQYQPIAGAPGGGAAPTNWNRNDPNNYSGTADGYYGLDGTFYPYGQNAVPQNAPAASPGNSSYYGSDGTYYPNGYHGPQYDPSQFVGDANPYGGFTG